MTQITYNFNPNDPVWFVDSNRQVKFGTVINVNFSVYKNSMGNLQEDVIYKISYSSGTKIKSITLKQEFLFETMQDAVDYLFGTLVTPTASAPPSPTATPTNTPTITPTLTVTPSPSFGAPVTPTPSITVSPSITPTISVTPTITPTISNTPSSTPTGYPYGQVGETRPHTMLVGSRLAELQTLMNTNTTAASRFRTAVNNRVAGANYYDFPEWYVALMYVLTGDVSYANFAISRVETFVSSEESRILAYGNNTSQTRPAIAGDSYLESGPLLLNVGLVYDWCYSLLTEEQRTRWTAYANQTVFNIWNPEQASWGGRLATWTGWSINNPFNNYYYSFLTATMIAYTAFTPENPQSLTWRQIFRVNKIRDQLVPSFIDFVGGGSREGSGYGTAYRTLFILFNFWQDSTGESLAELTALTRESIDYWCHIMTPTLNYFAPWGDHSRDSTGALYDYQRTLLMAAAKLYPTRTASRASKTLLQNSSLPQTGNVTNWIYDYLFDYTTIDGLPLEDLGTHYRAEGAGHIFWRSSWNTNASYLSISYSNLTESHDHQDKGSFYLYKNTWLAYDQNMNSSSGIIQTVPYHNMIRLVNGTVNIAQQYNTARPIVHHYDVSNSDYYYMSLDTRTMYSPSFGISQNKRDYVYFLDDVVVIFDRVATNPGISKVWQMNSPYQPSISGNVADFTAGSNTLRATVVEPATPALSVFNWAGTTENLARYISNGYRLDVTSTQNTEHFLVVLDINNRVANIESIPGNVGEHTVRLTFANSVVRTITFYENTQAASIVTT